MNVEHVRYVERWTDERFVDDDNRLAAEPIAFDVLEPGLRSRGRSRQAARATGARSHS